MMAIQDEILRLIDRAMIISVHAKVDHELFCGGPEVACSIPQVHFSEGLKVYERVLELRAENAS